MSLAIISPLLASPLLPWITLIAVGNLAIMMYRWRYSLPIEQRNTFIIVLITMIVGANLLLLFLGGYIRGRYVREILTFLPPFFAIGFLSFIRSLPKRFELLITCAFIIASVLGELNEFAKYERIITIDWGHYRFYQWLDRHLPQDAIVLTDPFTMRTMVGAVPFIQSPKQSRQMQSTNPSGTDPITNIFSGSPQRMMVGFKALCPQYVVIDRSTTQQFYPVVIQDTPELFSNLMTVIYNDVTKKSMITVFQLRPATCTPLPSSIHSPT